MGWRFLVDEDTDIETVDELVERGHDALPVETALGRGTSDDRVARFARDEDRVLITTDRDFLDPEVHVGIRVLLVVDSDAKGRGVAGKADELAGLADDSIHLKNVTWI